MNSNNLIAGFEDIITHIRQQEFRIKELENHKKQLTYENKKLKEDNWATEEALKIVKDENEINKKNLKKYQNTILSLKSHVVDLREARDMREQKIKELKEEHNQYATHWCFHMKCEECGLPTTEDDLAISLKHGSLICEGCCEESESESESESEEEES